MSSSSCTNSIATSVGIPQGLAFGIILQKSRMSAPENIKNQMYLKDWTMMKTFLSASGTSTISLGLLNLFNLATLAPFNINWRGNIIGGLIMGTGLTLGGACPGTVLAQIGEGVTSSPYTLLGGLLGAISYGSIINIPSIQGILQSKEVSGSFNTINGLLNQPMWSIALPFGSCLIGIALLLEKLFPTPKYQSSNNKNDRNLMKMKQWNPILSGIALGSLQIPVNLFVKTYLGTSSAFVTAASFLTRYLPVNQSYFDKYALSAGPKYVWQLISDISIITGSYISSIMGNTRVQPKKLTLNEKLMAIASGFLLLFGARCANGCTSGHGLSQMANLSFAGLLTIASMMASGIGLGVTLSKLQSSNK
ncbi:predicted protein [Naegleria gruberi]|uniref:Predicted protein n=1 Tax=Naegleria gruberi TaxID=5762 RepID=D2V5B8_NAEGR|nr:uncharacterized protein NAEGRDRAFT_63765 [Naegleria gruberi]EFC48083.1 predicted protein [Naegleria gruberi]|eukprot:XP_002680827.1 predicted protein [Naegleria gruberi strain NEG-M]